MQRPRRFRMLSCPLRLNRTSPTLIGGMNATQENELGFLLFTVSSSGLAPNSENLIKQCGSLQAFANQNNASRMSCEERNHYQEESHDRGQDPATESSGR